MTNVHTANAQHGLPPLQPIARIAMPAREAFFEDYVWPCKPVVLTDLARQWGDSARWEPRALAARADGPAEAGVRVRQGRHRRAEV